MGDKRCVTKKNSKVMEAVTLSEADSVHFSLDELVKRVNILMKHELKNAIIYLNISVLFNKNC